MWAALIVAAGRGGARWVRGRGRPGSGGRVGDCFEFRERGGERGGPRPGCLEAQPGLAGVEGEPGGDVKQPVAQALGLGFGEVSGELRNAAPAAKCRATGRVVADPGLSGPYRRGLLMGWR